MKSKLRQCNLLFLVILLSSAPALALPIFNRNTPGAEKATIYPDHQNPNLYYYAPNTMLIATDPATDAPLFKYNEYYESRRSLVGVVQTILQPSFHEPELQGAFTRIKAQNPQALFVALPFESSQVIFLNQFEPLISSNECTHLAGNVLDDQACVLTFTPRGRATILPAIRSGLGIAIQFRYTVLGVKENADGHYDNDKRDVVVGGRIGGSLLGQHPELFVDAYGDPIEFR